MRKLFVKMLALVLVSVMVTILLPGIIVFAEREYAADVSIMSKIVDFKNAPYSEFGTVLVALEELCGYIGIAVSKEGDMYTMTRADDSVQIQVGNMYAVVNGVRNDLLVSPVERGGVFYVPVEFFSRCFGIPVSVSNDARSADIKPNVYTINIDEQHAAAVSAQQPDADVLATGTQASDILRDHMDLYPEKSSYVYYMANLSFFEGKTIESASLNMTVVRNEVGPSITAVRTASWTKGQVTWNNQPAICEERTVEFKTTDKGDVKASLDILPLVNAARKEGIDLSMKILGTHRAGAKNELDKHPYTVYGVNTVNAPYIEVAVEETYNFPVKETSQESTEDENRYSEMGILRSLGVFTENDEFPLDLNEGVVRYEFIRYALRLANAQIAKGSSQHFSDVPSDSLFYDEVNTARSLGYIAGDVGVAFRPYDFITVGEAITVMGRILNYDVYAEERGGYTPGYFDAARIGELYMGAATAAKILSFNEMFKILRNALDAAILEVTTYSSNGTAEYIFNENKNILTEYWNAKVIEGTVTKNEFSDLKNPAGSGKENTIYIDSKELKLLYKEYNNFLGYRVKGWYDNDDRLLYMGIREYDITEIDLASVTGDSVSGSTVTFTYERGNGSNASESFSVGSDKYVVYNGKSIAKGDLGKILLSKADGGSIKLIGDSLAVIDAYRTIVVSTVDAENERIYDLYDSYGNTLSLKDCENYAFKDEKGAALALSAISKENVISVAKSLDGTLVKGIVGGGTLSGKIDAIEDEGTENMILTVNGVEYKIANQNTVWTSRVDVGASGLFYIDTFGRIVGFESEKITDIPGYIITVAEGGGTLKQKLQAAIMIQDSEDYVVYDFADKVEIDGKQKKTIEAVKACFNNETTGVFETQGIIFSLNKDGKINKVDTYYKDSQRLDPTDKESPRTTLNKRTVEATPRYEGGIFYNHYFCDADSTLTVLNTAKDTPSIEDYQTLATILPDDHERSTTELYTIGNLTPNVSIAYAKGVASTTLGNDEPLMLFDRSMIAFDEDGYEVTKLYYYDGTRRLSVIARDDLLADTVSTISAMNRGDIFRFATDSQGKLSAAKRVYDYENRAFVPLGEENGSSVTATYYLGPEWFKRDGIVFGGYTTHVEDGNLRVSQKPDFSDEDLADTTTMYRWISIANITKNGFYKFTASSAGIEVAAATENDIRQSCHAPLASTGIVLLDKDNILRRNVWLLDLSEMYTYSYSAGEGVNDVTLDTSAKRVSEGEVIALAAAPSRVNYDFTGWDVNGTIYQPGDSYQVSSNVKITATWVYNPTINFYFKDPTNGNALMHTESWSINKSDGSGYSEHTLPTQETLEASGYVKEGYTLVGWTKGSNEYAAGEAYIPGNDGYTADSTEGGTFEAVWMQAWTGTASSSAPEVVEGVYQITTAEELAWFSDFVDSAAPNASANAKLVNDIYLNNFADCGDGEQINETTADWFDSTDNVKNAKNWHDYAIGRTNAYQGTFDGNGKTIYGLYTTSTASDIGGLFFNITGGTVKNLTVKGAYVLSQVAGGKYDTGRASVIANIVNGGTIEGVTAYGKITAAADCSANLAGSIAVELQGSAVIRNNTSYVNIDLSSGSTTLDTSASSNQHGVGGIVGAVKSGSGIIINGNKNYGNINAPYTKAAAGILAWANSDSYFNRNEFTGNVNYGNIVAGQLAHQIVAARKAAAASENSAFANIINQNTASGSATVFVPTTP